MGNEKCVQTCIFSSPHSAEMKACQAWSTSMCSDGWLRLETATEAGPLGRWMKASVRRGTHIW